MILGALGHGGAGTVLAEGRGHEAPRLSSLLRPRRPCLRRLDDDPYAGETVKSDDGKADASALGVFLDAQFDGKLVDRLVVGRQPDDPGPAALHGRPAQRHDRGRPRRQGRGHEHQEVARSTARRRSRTRAKLPIIWNKHNAHPDRDRPEAAARHLVRGPGSVRRRSTRTSCVDFGAHDVDCRLDVLLLPPEGLGLQARRRRRPRDDRDALADADVRRPASSPSTTRSGRTTRSTSSRSSASTRTARRPRRRRHRRATTSSSTR